MTTQPEITAKETEALNLIWPDWSLMSLEEKVARRENLMWHLNAAETAGLVKMAPEPDTSPSHNPRRLVESRERKGLM